MTNENFINDLFEEFEVAVEKAREVRGSNEKAGAAFEKLVRASGRETELLSGKYFSRTSFDRWIRGQGRPSRKHLEQLRKFFFQEQDPGGISYEELVSEKFAPLVEIIAEYNKNNSDTLPAESVAELVRFIRRARGKLKKGSMLDFLDI